MASTPAEKRKTAAYEEPKRLLDACIVNSEDRIILRLVWGQHTEEEKEREIKRKKKTKKRENPDFVNM